MGVISLIEAKKYELPLLRKVVRQHFETLDVGSQVRGRPVVVKPNMVMRTKPERAATTHPLFLEAVLLELQGLGAENIVVADSPGGPYVAAVLENFYKGTGMWDAAARCGVPCNTDVGTRGVHRAENTISRDFELIEPVCKGAFMVNLCRVKTHSMMTFTCGVKNLFGTIPGLAKPQMHYRFPEQARFGEMLVDLCLTVKPNLTIADGIVGMEGDGPTAGTPVDLGVTAAALGENVFPMDLLLSHMCGLKPEQVPTVTESIKRGLSPSDWKDVAVTGDVFLKEKVVPFKLPKSKSLDFLINSALPLTWVSRFVQNIVAPRPVIRQKDCIACGQCVRACPVQTIRLQPMVDPKDKCHHCSGCGQCEQKMAKRKAAPKRAFIYKDKCIRCFCCHELCPAEAIDIKRMLW